MVHNQKNGAKTPQQEENLIASFWALLLPEDKSTFLNEGILSEDAEYELLRLGHDTTELEIYVESLDNAGDDMQELEKTSELPQEVIFETQEVTPKIVEEVKTETKISEKSKGKGKSKGKPKEKQVIQQVQQVTQNLTVNLEQPKDKIRKLTPAEKVAEAQKLLGISEKKEYVESLLKEFYIYLHANKDGDNFCLKSFDGNYKFSTNSLDLVKEVQQVVEKHLKRKIESLGDEMELIQIA